MTEEIWQEPVRGVWGHPAIGSLPGLEAARGFIDGRLPAPPIGRLTGLLMTDAGSTHSVFALPVTPWLLDATGYLIPASAALVSDAPLGSALNNSLPAGKVTTTSELSISYLRPAGLDAERLVAHAAVIKAGRSTGLTEARITDANGRLLAHATSRLVIIDVPVDPNAVLPQPAEVPETPDPWRREAVGQIADQSTLATYSGREIFQRWLSGDLPRPPISYLTGIKPLGFDDETVRWSMPASPWLCSPAPYLYGGSTALLAHTAVHSAVLPSLPAGVELRPLDLRLRFLRPVFPDGSDLVAQARLVHRGRGLVVAQGEVRTADGKVALLAESSLLLRSTRS